MKAIIFDWDGTLADSFYFNYKIYKQIAKELVDFELTIGRFRSSFGFGQNKLHELIGFPPEMGQAVHKRYKEIYAERVGDIRLLPGVKETLEALHAKGIKLAVVTNAGHWRTEKEAKVLGIYDLFELIFGWEDVPAPKPDPRGLLKALKQIGVKPSEAAYVGDMANDIRTARAAGVKAIGVPGGIHGRKELMKEKPDLLLGSMKQLAGSL